jgi:N6-adenosine-specific RNA methylase IME4
MTDSRFTKNMGDLLLVTKHFYEYGIDEGLTTPKDLRLTIEKRQEMARALVDSGMSRRKAAKVLGVSKGTVNNAVGGQQVAKSGQKLSTPSERREAALREQLRIAQTPAAIPDDKRYGTVVIDPPWPMKKIERDVRPNQVEFDYPTMDYEELRAFRPTFQRLADDECHVFMWTTHRFLPMALRLIEDYGVKYVLTMVWHKPGGFQPVGLPQYNCEFVVYGRIGSPEFIDTKAFNCCFDAPRTEHSRKPGEFYEVVRRVTAGERIDIFSREKRDGFDQFGNEVDKFSEAAE